MGNYVNYYFKFEGNEQELTRNINKIKDEIKNLETTIVFKNKIIDLKSNKQKIKDITKIKKLKVIDVYDYNSKENIGIIIMLINEFSFDLIFKEKQKNIWISYEFLKTSRMNLTPEIKKLIGCIIKIIRDHNIKCEIYED